MLCLAGTPAWACPRPGACGHGRDHGAVTLEATLVLVIMLPIGLALMALFPMLLVQGRTAHALLQTAESLALDSYAADQINSAANDDVYNVKLDKVIAASSDLEEVTNSSYTTWNYEETSPSERARSFTRLDKWYAKQPDEKNDLGAQNQRIINEVVRPRFIMYLGGEYDSDYSKLSADQFLRNMFVVDGLEGLSFEDTTVTQSKVDGRELFITLRYKYKYPLMLLHLGDERTITQSTRVRLWARP